MADHDLDISSPRESRFGLRAVLLREWPYFAMLVLALFGVAYASIARREMTWYWILLAPVFGMICVAASWGKADGREERVELVRTQALHWLAVLSAMYLVSMTSVRQMMNADAGALVVLVVLALGTFTAGVHSRAWRISLVGIVLGLGAPAIAWLEEATLLLALIGIVVIGFVAAPFLRRGADND
jgi:hypothetical protein